MEAADAALKFTPLADAHRALGAKMVPFAGYDMPVQYPTGVLSEHNWTRENAGLFDVSHMGQAFLVAADNRYETVARALESLCAADILNLKPRQQRYSQLLADDGGILDDFMVTRSAYPGHDGTLYLVVNAACKDADFAHIAARLPAGVALNRHDDLALIAIQGPKAANVMTRIFPQSATATFMSYVDGKVDGRFIHASRSGYTGEDGFELCVEGKDAGYFWSLLLAQPEVKPIGLGARDSLRLEAGLCLYGHDIDTTTSPVEAALVWSMQKRRREEGGFPGADRIQRELRDGPARLRVGIRPEGRAPAREGTDIQLGGRTVGIVTSGGFGPTLNGPLAMGYVEKPHATAGTAVDLVVRGKPLPATIVPMPFVPNRYKR